MAERSASAPPFPHHDPVCPYQQTPMLSACTCGEAERLRQPVPPPAKGTITIVLPGDPPGDPARPAVWAPAPPGDFKPLVVTVWDAAAPPPLIRCRTCGEEWEDTADIRDVTCTCLGDDEDWVVIGG